MSIDSYFDFLAPDDIRIKGTRIGIESVLYEYIHRGQSPEQIAAQFHSVALEQVYATILYYLQQREQLDAYMADWLAWSRTVREQQAHHVPEVVRRLRERRAEQHSIEQ